MSEIVISTTRILDRIYAETALRHLLDENRPPLLHRDRQNALECIVSSAFADMCLALIPAITDCNVGSDADDEMMRMSVDIPDGSALSLPVLRTAIEHAIARKTLADAYQSVDPRYADELHRQFGNAVKRCRELIGLGRIGRIKPHWL